jgi:hypothetical protein
LAACTGGHVRLLPPSASSRKRITPGHWRKSLLCFESMSNRPNMDVDQWLARFLKDVLPEKRQQIQDDPDVKRALANQDMAAVEKLAAAIAFGNIASHKLAKQEEKFKELKNEFFRT